MHFPILIWSAQEPLMITLFLSTCWLHSIGIAFEKILLFQLNNKPDNLQRDVRQVPARLHNHSCKLLSQETSQVPATLDKSDPRKSKVQISLQLLYPSSLRNRDSRRTLQTTLISRDVNTGRTNDLVGRYLSVSQTQSLAASRKGRWTACTYLIL